MTGQIFIPFAELDSPIFAPRGPCSRSSAWFWMLRRATSEEYSADPFSNLSFGRGELPYTVRAMAAAWDWPERTVRRFVSELVAAGMVQMSKRGAWQIITIANVDRLVVGGRA